MTIFNAEFKSATYPSRYPEHKYAETAIDPAEYCSTNTTNRIITPPGENFRCLHLSIDSNHMAKELV